MKLYLESYFCSPSVVVTLPLELPLVLALPIQCIDVDCSLKEKLTKKFPPRSENLMRKLLPKDF